MKCPPCKGSGRFGEISHRPCLLCAGKGFVSDDRASWPSCAYCCGKGIVGGFSRNLCEVCGGWGRVSPLPTSNEHIVYQQAPLPLESPIDETARYSHPAFHQRSDSLQSAPMTLSSPPENIQAMFLRRIWLSKMKWPLLIVFVVGLAAFAVWTSLPDSTKVRALALVADRLASASTRG